MRESIAARTWENRTEYARDGWNDAAVGKIFNGSADYNLTMAMLRLHTFEDETSRNVVYI
jgi:hypothetical protein